MVSTGNVVEEFYIGQTKVRFCDDYCGNATKADIEEILRRIADKAIGPLSLTSQDKNG